MATNMYNMKEEHSIASDMKRGNRKVCTILPILFKIMVQQALGAISEAEEGVSTEIRMYILAFAGDVPVIAEKCDDLKILMAKLLIKN